MKALVFHKPKDIRVEDLPLPRIEHARDVVVRVSAASICGSDLHIFNGYLPQRRPFTLGHEFMGVVEEVGPRVFTVKKGDRVIVPCLIACGRCYFCDRGLPGQCEISNPRRYGPDGIVDRAGGVFGYGDDYGGYDGGQAEFVRVPFADFGLRKVPDGVSEEHALLMGDVIPTGWTAAEWCDLKGGETVAVFGCGPVGVMALKAARLMGAGRLIAVDIQPYRRELAWRLTGAELVDPALADPVDAIRHMTEGRGADACIDAVGMEAEHGWVESMSNVIHRQVGTTKVLRAALRAARRGGAVSVIGLYGGEFDNFPVGQLFDKSLRVRSGPAPIHAKVDMLLDLVVRGQLVAEDLVTHRMPLEEAPRAYRLFNDKRDHCLKVVLRPRPAPPDLAKMKRLGEHVTA